MAATSGRKQTTKGALAAHAANTLLNAPLSLPSLDLIAPGAVLAGSLGAGTFGGGNMNHGGSAALAPWKPLFLLRRLPANKSIARLRAIHL